MDDRCFRWRRARRKRLERWIDAITRYHTGRRRGLPFFRFVVFSPYQLNLHVTHLCSRQNKRDAFHGVLSRYQNETAHFACKMLNGVLPLGCVRRTNRQSRGRSTLWTGRNTATHRVSFPTQGSVGQSVETSEMEGRRRRRNLFGRKPKALRRRLFAKKSRRRGGPRARTGSRLEEIWERCPQSLRTALRRFPFFRRQNTKAASASSTRYTFWEYSPQSIRTALRRLGFFPDAPSQQYGGAKK